MLRIRSELPAIALLGESELIVTDALEGVGVRVGGGGGCTEAAPPPQPDIATTTAVNTAIPMTRHIESPLSLFKNNKCAELLPV
jgi:hypothetical protein